MEQWFRIALCMFLLTGYLQAQPVTPKECWMNQRDLSFDLLKDVSCENNVNFTIPTTVPANCHAKALEYYKDGLDLATKKCDKQLYIHQILETMNVPCSQNTQTQCNFTMTVHEQFASFLNATKEFAQEFNAQQSN